MFGAVIRVIRPVAGHCHRLRYANSNHSVWWIHYTPGWPCNREHHFNAHFSATDIWRRKNIVSPVWI